MLSDCLNNYIGLDKKCTTVPSVSGLFVNTLPGISLKLLANIAQEEQRDYVGIFNEIYDRTLHDLESDVLVKAQKYFKTTNVVDNKNTGYYADPYATSVATNEFKGTTIEADSRTSRFLSIYVSSVQLYLPVAVNDNILIYNLMNGVLLDTIAFTGVVGINTIEINKNYITYGQDTKIFVCYNSTNVGDSINTTSVDSSTVAITRGAAISTSTQVIKNNLTFAGNSHGLIANYNIRCDISEFICTSKDAFKFAFLWRLGANIMFERRLSDRMNKYTLTMTPLQLKQLHEDYLDEYEKIMASVMDNLEANTDRVCFSCRKERNYKYDKP